MGNTNSTEGNNIVTSIQRRRSRSSSSASIQKPIQPAETNSSSIRQPFQLSITEPETTEPTEPTITEDTPTVTKEIPIKMKRDETNDNTPTVPASTGKGWVSSTGAASPWFGYLSNSVNSHHRASISGPYYRTRGMSVTRDNENDEDLSTITPAITSNPDTVVNPDTVDTNTSTLDTNTPPITNPTPHPAITIHPTAPPTTTSHGVPTIITWAQGGNNVYVTGTFNGWKHKIKLVKSSHDFSAVLELPPGTHRLKFIVDDEWKCSNDMETATDPDGNLVNYLQVLDDEEENEQDDFDVTTNDKYSNTIPPELLQLAALSETTEEAKKKSVLEWEKKQPQPPTLPPHLEKVLLNSNIVSEEDNSVLQEPNHVTLNHLYACSIKDNVMALATTSRYRKKYVTTMYYRPVFPKT